MALRDVAGWMTRDESTVIVGLAVLGVACGIVAKIADESQVRWAADLGTYPAAWVLAIALIARFAPSMLAAAVRATAFFVAVCAAYYGWSWLVMGFGVDRYLVLWIGIAITVVPIAAALIRWASAASGPAPGIVLASVAALAVADRLAWQLWWAWGLNAAPEGFPLRPFQALVGVAVAVVIAGVLPRPTRTRLWALALLVPVSVVIARILDLTMGHLLRLV